MDPNTTQEFVIHAPDLKEILATKGLDQKDVGLTLRYLLHLARKRNKLLCDDLSVFVAEGATAKKLTDDEFISGALKEIYVRPANATQLTVADVG